MRRSIVTALLLSSIGCMSNRNLYEPSLKVESKGNDVNNNRVKTCSKQEKLFKVKGFEVMAYSRKDAIKRLIHRGLLKKNKQ